MRRIKKYQQGGMSNFLDILNNNAGSILGGAADLFQQYQQINDSGYNTKSQANKATAINVMKGAATGAAAGSVFGPVGTAVGAVVGAIPGIVGNKSSVAKNGYYADPNIQYGTGILGSKTSGAAKREYDERMGEVIGNRTSAVTGAYNQALWNNEFDAENQLFAANGGNISDLAWVDDGEVLMTPDMSVYNVPERNQPEDSNLVNIPEGTKILSDKLKVPGTKETFASMAKKLQSKKGKYNDKYSQGSAEANAINDKIVFDTLFNMQESMKNGKKEYKKGLQEFQEGGQSNSQNVLPFRVNYDLFRPETQNTVMDWLKNSEYYINPIEDIKPRVTNIINDNDRRFAAGLPPIEDVVQNTTAYVPTRIMQTDDSAQELPNLSRRRFTIGTPNFSNLATNLASLYGPVSDLGVTPEVFNPVFNPYEGAVADLMGRRRYDIQPTINALRRANASANYAASQLNTNTGANLAFRLQNALRTNSAINEAYANAALQNNQYAADYANTLNQIGANRAQVVDTNNMRNAQNRATARNIIRNARNAIGQWAQVQQQMRNQRSFDSAMMDLYKPFLESGFRTEDYNKLIRQYSR